MLIHTVVLILWHRIVQQLLGGVHPAFLVAIVSPLGHQYSIDLCASYVGDSALQSTEAKWSSCRSFSPLHQRFSWSLLMRQFLGDRRPKAQRPRAPSSRHDASESVSLHYVCLGPVVWRYLYVYIYMYICMHVCMYVCMSLSLYIYLYLYLYVHKHIHTKVYMHIHVYAVWTYLHTHHILICPPTCLSVYRGYI